jgi:magnesium transporter
MIVDCAHYRDGRRQQAAPMPAEEAAAICRREPGFVWLGMVEPQPDELVAMQDVFGLHELAVEDAQSFHLRPKVEQYDEGVTFVILRTARYVEETEEVDFGEVAVFVGESFLITVRQGAASDLHGSRLRLEQRPQLLEAGPHAALWAILDKVVDDYAPVVEALERDIEEVEHTVFAAASAPTERIYQLRREVTDFYRAVHPLLLPLDAIERGTQVSVSPKLRPFFRDINDHVKYTEEEIIAQREALAVMLQTNMAVISVQQNDISVRQNEISKQLTIIATIFLPLTFITGFFGQNFGWMVGHIDHLWSFLVFGIGSLIASLVVLWAWFQRRGYFTREDE